MFGVSVIGIPSAGIFTAMIVPNGPFVTGKVPIPTSSIVSPIIPGVVSGMISARLKYLAG